ncbi:hypothetical protein I6B53_05190 [Schaalia sp. 19OD2882]|uniref:SatD family protein n=1 Tax=Schaalia sp. 19OD2882 TaxID=2794089 RepID=UPI001C1EBC9C|nr:SatD family protein [Schaalia sp. 19OD2882]QWW20463.1 hypothetical protein I6B53_05190 [Schaalia sp. 19OD2882]
MFVLTIDQESSRHGEDRVPALLEALAHVPALRPFVRTVGDEVQAVFDNPQAVLEVLMWVQRDGHWHCGLGVGGGELPDVEDAPDSRSGRGDAFVHARTAVDEAKRNPSSVAVRADRAEAAAQTQALLGLLDIIRAGRTDRQWAIIDEVEAAGGITPAAQRLGVSAQNVSQAYARSARKQELACHPLLLRLLTELDEGRL